MGKKNGAGKTITLAPATGNEDSRAVEVFELRVQGVGYAEIGEQMGVSGWEARELASLGYQKLATEQADEIRAGVEARYDDIVRRLYEDLRLAANQATRNSIYSLLLRADTERRKLLGLDIPTGTPDAPPAGNL